tara:strand:+ start:73 stop:363 length:291 start_codon:yes stop_codon:yes gene_type:complete
MRRSHRQKLTQLVVDSYASESLEIKEEIQNMLFVYYYDRNEQDFYGAMQELNEDIALMEGMEQYERCHILKDILDRFESISDEEVRRDNTNVEEDM